MSRFVLLSEARTAVRVVLYSVTGTAVISGAGFIGTHLYIESTDPTPPSWPQQLRCGYRAAVFNSRYLDQQSAAKANLIKLLEVLQTSFKVSDEPPLDKSSIPEAAKLDRARGAPATSDEGIGKALMLFADIEKKQGNLLQAMEKYGAALPYFAANMQLQSSAARCLGEVQESSGLVAEAHQSFELAVHSLLPQYRFGLPLKTEQSATYSPELLQGIKAMALLRARQGQYKDALSTLLSILQCQRSNTAVTNRLCDTASTMTNIAELVWVLGDSNESRRWTHESLDICTTSRSKDDKRCIECAGINYNILGLLDLKAGSLAEAKINFIKAIRSAEMAGDASGLNEYSENMERCV